jgi:FMN phosphatase YigB (HAD superfamily)
VIRAVLLDVLGTLCYLDEPGPRLRRELAARGIDVPEDAAARASRAEIAYYLEHQMEGATAAGLEDLRDRCAGVIRDSLGLPAERQADVRAAMLDSLVFVPFPDAVPALRALRERGLRLVAASNWDVSLEDALARMGLAPLLDGAVSSVVAGAAQPATSSAAQNTRGSPACGRCSSLAVARRRRASRRSPRSRSCPP